MRTMKQHFLLLMFMAFLIGGCTSLFQKGQNQFQSGEYQLAINTFSKVLEEDPENKEANFYVAESYRLSNRIEQSALFYQKTIGEEESYEEYYRLGQSLKSQGKFEEADAAFKKAKELTLDDTFQAELDREISNLKKIDEIEDYWPFIQIENYKLLNTPGLDYGPIVSEEFLYFTSSRRPSGIYPSTGQGYTKLFRARADGIKVDVQNVQELPEFRNEEGLNQADIAISPDGNTIIYARGNSTSNKDLPEVALFVSYFRGAGFTQPIWLPVNVDEFFWNSNPAFRSDGNELYFSSNRPGGFGGNDLYKAIKLANGDFGNPVNMGPQINTPGNEMYPRPAPDGKFFFSSDGHPGFGKLDLFVAEASGTGWEIKNLGPKINSVGDDFALSFTKYPLEGFLSSNREGGQGGDDIYYFEDKTPKAKIINVFLTVTTKEKKEDGFEPILPQTRVALYDSLNKMTGGDFSNQNGTIRFTLTPNQRFALIASKNGYFSKSIPYNTTGKTPKPEDLIQDVTNVALDTTIVLEPLILERSIVLDNIYYDLNMADIRPDAALELDKLVQILKDNPSVRIELSSHTDARASDDYNDALSQKRAESAVDYLVSKGINASRLIAKGYGKRQLIIQNAQTEEEHQVNRRTEFKVIEITN